MKKRILCLLLAMLMLLPVISGCTEPTPDTPKESETDTPDPGEVGEPSEEVEVNPYDVADSLPDVSYGGREFVIHYYRDAYGAFFYQ